jgi:predicted mannosyl-3-phosphoglycerate phosphatase (HAD superfamily)
VRPVRDLDAAEARALRGLLFDLDDTVLTHGALERQAYDALWSLRDAGLALVAVTGRPAGWGEVIARQWPVAGCVVENGAVYLVRDGAGVRLHDGCDAPERKARRARLADHVERVRAAIPDAKPTDDVASRVSDVTWDVGERVKLPPGRVAAIVAVIEAVGARWSLSSVHLHATFDGTDKAGGAVAFCSQVLGEDPGAVPTRFAFAGDSGNDAPCFAAMHTTFGVANVRSSLGRLVVPPRYIASLPMGAGFAEIAREITRKRAELEGASRP